MILMGWRGAGGSGASNIGVLYFFGGLLMILGAVGEVSDRRHAARLIQIVDEIDSGSLVTHSHSWSLAPSAPSGLPSLRLYSPHITHMVPSRLTSTTLRRVLTLQPSTPASVSTKMM